MRHTQLRYLQFYHTLKESLLATDTTQFKRHNDEKTENMARVPN